MTHGGANEQRMEESGKSATAAKRTHISQSHIPVRRREKEKKEKKRRKKKPRRDKVLT